MRAAMACTMTMDACRLTVSHAPAPRTVVGTMAHHRCPRPPHRTVGGVSGAVFYESENFVSFLSQLRLGEFGSAFTEHGYDDLSVLAGLDESSLVQVRGVRSLARSLSTAQRMHGC